MTSFENTKSEIVSSGLGQAIGLTVSNTWAQIVTKIKAIINRGALNWSGSNTTKTVEAGYYSGGTIDSRPSYNNGYNAGVAAADGRANPDSTNYKTGYNAGVAAADARVNTGSASYTSGYNAGVSAGRIVKVSSQVLISSSNAIDVQTTHGTHVSWYPIVIPLNFTHTIVSLWASRADGASGQYYQCGYNSQWGKADWNYFIGLETYNGANWRTNGNVTIFVNSKNSAFNVEVYYV